MEDNNYPDDYVRKLIKERDDLRARLEREDKAHHVTAGELIDWKARAEAANRILTERGVRVYAVGAIDPWLEHTPKGLPTHEALLVGIKPIAKKEETAEELLREMSSFIRRGGWVQHEREALLKRADAALDRADK